MARRCAGHSPLPAPPCHLQQGLWCSRWRLDFADLNAETFVDIGKVYIRRHLRVAGPVQCAHALSRKHRRGSVFLKERTGAGEAVCEGGDVATVSQPLLRPRNAWVRLVWAGTASDDGDAELSGILLKLGSRSFFRLRTSLFPFHDKPNSVQLRIMYSNRFEHRSTVTSTSNLLRDCIYLRISVAWSTLNTL